MMVTFVSQCEKKALNRTRRVMDAFADRIGDNTWQTVITQEGLNAVKKLLRRTASKNTAVSCHWIRSRSRSDLVWVVGNRSKFNTEGLVPVNSTRRKILDSQRENDWHHLPSIKALTALSALLHDWGKSTELFQRKLSNSSKFSDPIRHEWISCLLLNALVCGTDSSSDQGWLECLISGELNEEKLKQRVAEQQPKPLKKLPPIAGLIAWLVVSHHRLPTPSTNSRQLKNDWQGESATEIDVVLSYIQQSWGYENRKDEQEYQSRVEQCFEFPNGLLSQSKKWLSEIRKWAQRLQLCQHDIENMLANGSFRVLLHHSRLCLMLGDHNYSSQNADPKWQNATGLFANTDRESKELKQKLDEHLVGVAKSALSIAHLLPAFEIEPPYAKDTQSLKQKSRSSAFRWQDKAVDVIAKWKKKENQQLQGVFAVNMASTGSGKTFANAKVMRALSHDSDSLRYILALGLRTLTLQTGDEYRERIGLESDELAVLIGSKAVTELHNQVQIMSGDTSVTSTGSESEESLLDELVDYDCDIPEERLTTVLTKERDRQFLYAPVLACTIDHMMSATETKRGGRYILPSLRLMSSDLVIDEIDDFTGSDLVAIGRLIHLAGMLGRNVMISSATIPPDLAEGYFNAYKEGWILHSKNRDASADIACIWIDEFKTVLTEINSTQIDDTILKYREHHSHFVDKRVANLSIQSAKRKACVIECRSAMEEVEFDEAETKQQSYFSLVQQAIIAKHREHHCIDQITSIAVSFGVVRVANISPCVALTKFLLKSEYPDDIEVRVMAYHSQQVLLLRHEQERHLDGVLKRKEEPGSQPNAFSDPFIRKHLDTSTVKNVLFILVATPVEEVGRDHDFDWAVVEPSSFRSIVQLAGRVHRHREEEINTPNVALMQYNWNAFRGGDESQKKYFIRPGYETLVTMDTHDLTQLVDTGALAEKIDATARIKRASTLNHRHSLADLEHYENQRLLSNYKRFGPEALQGYLTGTWWLTALPQYLNPFRQSEPSTNLFLTYDEVKDNYFFAEKDERGYPVNREGILQISHNLLTTAELEKLWLVRDYSASVDRQVDLMKLSRWRISLRYGELNFVERENEVYEYNDQFGLMKV